MSYLNKVFKKTLLLMNVFLLFNLTSCVASEGKAKGYGIYLNLYPFQFNIGYFDNETKTVESK